MSREQLKPELLQFIEGDGERAPRLDMLRWPLAVLLWLILLPYVLFLCLFSDD